MKSWERERELREEGIKEGIKEGREEGIKEGEENAAILYIKDIMKKLKYSVEQAMDLLNIPADKRAMYSKLIANDQATS